jgi:hypothetical protein
LHTDNPLHSPPWEHCLLEPYPICAAALLLWWRLHVIDWTGQQQNQKPDHQQRPSDYHTISTPWSSQEGTQDTDLELEFMLVLPVARQRDPVSKQVAISFKLLTSDSVTPARVMPPLLVSLICIGGFMVPIFDPPPKGGALVPPPCPPFTISVGGFGSRRSCTSSFNICNTRVFQVWGFFMNKQTCSFPTLCGENLVQRPSSAKYLPRG